MVGYQTPIFAAFFLTFVMHICIPNQIRTESGEIAIFNILSSMCCSSQRLLGLVKSDGINMIMKV